MKRFLLVFGFLSCFAFGQVQGPRTGVPAGTATNPGLFFNGDTNTGIFSSGADQLNLATNGVTSFSLSSTGAANIGAATMAAATGHTFNLPQSGNTPLNAHSGLLFANQATSVMNPVISARQTGTANDNANALGIYAQTNSDTAAGAAVMAFAVGNQNLTAGVTNRKAFGWNNFNTELGSVSNNGWILKGPVAQDVYSASAVTATQTTLIVLSGLPVGIYLVSVTSPAGFSPGQMDVMGYLYSNGAGSTYAYTPLVTASILTVSVNVNILRAIQTSGSTQTLVTSILRLR
jgi:hypothetical protein